jgi:hypothetical protein
MGKYFLLLLVVVALFANCPLENDLLDGKEGLDERLDGLWRFEYDRITVG